MALPALDEQQKAALEEMRKQFPEEEDSVLYRFLKARRFQPSDASKMLSACLEWRKEKKVEEIDPKTLKKELAFRRIYFHKRSKSGRICCVMQPGRHNPKTSDRDLALRMIIYFLETACSMLQEPTDKFAVVADLSGVGYSNVDMPLSKEVLRILSDYYPERLGEAYFVNSPFIFKSIWNVLKVFLDEETRSKFKFVDGKKGELLEYFEEDCLPKFLGGQSEYVYEPNEDGDGEADIGLIETNTSSSSSSSSSSPSPSPSPVEEKQMKKKKKKEEDQSSGSGSESSSTNTNRKGKKSKRKSAAGEQAA